jgi:predicted enzyme related to lactoylglutathione lyase
MGIRRISVHFQDARFFLFITSNKKMLIRYAMSRIPGKEKGIFVKTQRSFTMTAFKFISSVLLVQDVAVSKKFYMDHLSQEIAMDVGINVGFKSGLALWQKDYAHSVIFGPGARPGRGDDIELYFETENLADAWNHVRRQDIEVLHEPKEAPWCQRSFRIYDPDKFIIEIAESMEDVVKRLHDAGLSEDEVVKKSFMPAEMVRAILS